MQKEQRQVLTARMNLSERGHLEPKLLVCRVMFSLVWESKDGFSIRALTNTQMWFFTWRVGEGDREGEGERDRQRDFQ